MDRGGATIQALMFTFSSPSDANPFSTVLGFVQAQSRVAVCAVLNHLLELEPSLRALLTHHAGNTVLLRWPPKGVLPAGELGLRITQAQRFEPDDSTTPASVSITVLDGLLAAPAEQRLRFLRVEGDAMLAQTLAMLAQRLRWDAEHDLARLIGDAPAGWLARNAKALAADVVQAANALHAKTGAFLTEHDSAWLAGRVASQAHALDLAALKAQIDTVELRLKELRLKDTRLQKVRA